jgi:hypothetical protein
MATSQYLYTNNATTTLASSILVGATSLTVASGQGALFPNPTGTNYFMCTLQSTSSSAVEIVKCTARTSDTFTIVRAQEGTSASAFNAGDTVELRLTAGGLGNFPQLTALSTYTGNQVMSGSSSNAALTVVNIDEPITVSATAATGTINYDVTTQSVIYYTSNASGNFTVNFRGSSGTSLNTLLAVGDSISVSFAVTQGATAYYNSSVQVDGTTSGVSTKWQGGTAPTTGNASSVDLYNYVIIKTASATYTVLASQTKFA